MIPKQLQNPDFRFVLINKGTKKPFENDWPNTANYSYNDSKLLQHIEKETNYGVLGGYGNLCIIDCDLPQAEQAVEQHLPKTFSVRTGRGGRHFYYICKDLDSPIRLKDTHAGDIGDVQSKGKQVVGPGSIHQNDNTYKVETDIEIAETTASEIKFALRDFLIIKEKAEAPTNKEHENIEMNISDVINLSSLTKHGSEYYGPHPIHGSGNGMNFWVNTSKNIWHCFRHDTGGGPLSLIAVQEGIICCEDATAGALRGEKFLNTLKIAQEKYGLKLPETSSLKKLGTTISTRIDWRALAKDTIEKQGLFYDATQLWWMWNDEEKMWIIVDETDILNTVDEALDCVENTLKSSVKAEIIEALKREGRKHKPKELPSECIQFKDKIINIKTLESFGATKDYFALNPIPWSPNKEQECPTIDKLFEDWVGKEDKELLYEICAFCLYPKYFIHRIIVLTGGGSNGKSKFLGLLKKLVGTNNHASTEVELITANRFESVKTYKKLIIEMGETNFDKIRNTSKLKRMCGEDTIGFEFKNKKPFDDVNYAKIIIATNCLPQTEDRTDGFYRRWLIQGFHNQFEETNGDILETIPEEEYSGLATKCIGVLAKLMEKNAFCKDGSIQERREAYEKHSNPLQNFIDTLYEKDVNGKEPLYSFFDDYIAYLDEKKFRRIKKEELMKQLRNEGFDVERETIKRGDKYTKWYFVYGLKNKTGVAYDGTLQ